MKICVTASGKTMEASVDPRFGRCAYFLIYDTETKNLEAFDNPGNVQSSGAGVKAAEFIASKEFDVLITGNLGPNAVDIMSNLNFKSHFGVEGTVGSVINDYLKNE